MNMNKLAKTVTLIEGKKINLPIGQVKEVMKITLTELGKESDEEVMKVINKYRK